ncbi:MAG: 3-hydroxyacyl-CoA dehydrogenase NAD-binding domain-containing protein, partial [Brachybacterium sp.]
MTISTVTIVGAGYMGGGIAQVLAIAGFDVTIADVSVENANASLERLQKEARDFEEQGLYAPGSADLVAKNISAGKSIEDAVADVDFIEEAVFERIDVKRDVLGKISQHA